MMQDKAINIAILDLNNNTPNLGIPSIEILIEEQRELFPDIPIYYETFDVRHRNEIPDLSYDIYISSGGPGSPFEGHGTEWEQGYFDWLSSLWLFNKLQDASKRKFAIFICHSFQLMVRHFELGEVTQRKSESFGVLKCHPTPSGKEDELLAPLPDPFYIGDFRKWQVLHPNTDLISSIGGSILCYEKERPHVPLPRAVMGIRMSDQIVGFQFHPEANPSGMIWHFSQPQRKKQIIEHHGEEKFFQLMERLKDPDFLEITYNTILPRFLTMAIQKHFFQMVA